MIQKKFNKILHIPYEYSHTTTYIYLILDLR
jgi:hypothetical protein